MQASQILNRQEESIQRSSPSVLSVGRTVGILLLLQLIAALTLPFILAKPITVGSPDFLAAGSAHSFQIRSAVLLSFVGSALTVYLGITAIKVFRIYSKSTALLFVIVCALSCIIDLAHAGTIMSMLSLSSEFVASGTANSEEYKIIGTAVASARRSAHIIQLLAIGAWIFVFYISLFRFKLIPRVLASLGVIGIILQFLGVTVMMFLGNRPIGEMAMPLLPIQIIVGVWLIIKGFNHTLKPVAVVPAEL
jgi:hypothetical protein